MTPTLTFASFFYQFVNPNPPSDTNITFLVQGDFRALYRINPDHEIVLKYAAISGVRKDVNGSNLQDGLSFRVRLLGKFNETRNIEWSVPGARVGETVAQFDGITFSDKSNFLAPAGARILMPPTFQMEIEGSSIAQAQVGDLMRLNGTIGYTIEMKEDNWRKKS